MTDVIQIISTLGFPIFTAVVCFWFIKYTIDQHRQELKSVNENHAREVENLNNRHAEENKTMLEAINNNTAVMSRLCEKLEGVLDDKRTDK